MSNSVVLLCAAVAALAPFVSGQTRSEAARPAISDLRKQYVGLAGSPYDGRPDWTLSHIGDEKALEVDKGSLEILHKGILLLLDSYGNDGAAIKKGINDIQGEFAVRPDSADDTNVPFIDPFVINGDDGAAVGYFSEGAALGDPYLDFYARSNGHWDLRASVGEEYRTHTFFVAKLPSPLAGQAWYLAWGHRLGESGGNPLQLRLYAFDGNSVRTVWKRDGLVGGEVSVSGGKVTLEHEQAYHSNEPRVTETLYVTPNGLE